MIPALAHFPNGTLFVCLFVFSLIFIVKHLARHFGLDIYSFFDNNHDKVNLVAGVFFTTGTLGPAIGFMGGGALLNIYTDVGQVDLAR